MPRGRENSRSSTYSEDSYFGSLIWNRDIKEKIKKALEKDFRKKIKERTSLCDLIQGGYLEDLAEWLEDSKKVIEEDEKRIKYLTSELEKTKEKIREERNKLLDQRNKSVNDYEEQIASFKRQKWELEKKVKKYQGYNDNLDEYLKKLEEEKANLDTNHENLADKYKKIKNEINNLRKQLADSERERIRLEESLEQYQKEVNALKKENLQLKKTLAELEQLIEIKGLDKVALTDDYFQKVKDGGRLIYKKSWVINGYFLFADKDALEKFKDLCKVWSEKHPNKELIVEVNRGTLGSIRQASKEIFLGGFVGLGVGFGSVSNVVRNSPLLERKNIQELEVSDKITKETGIELMEEVFEKVVFYDHGDKKFFQNKKAFEFFRSVVDSNSEMNIICLEGINEKSLKPKVEEFQVHQTKLNNKNWRNIHSDFSSELQKEWEDKGFNYEQTKELIDIGLKPTDADFCVWLRDVKKTFAKWLLDHADIKKLQKEYKNESMNNENQESFKANRKKNTQEWLESNYPYPEEIEELDISCENLGGDLDLSEFFSLKKLDCSYNELTSLKLSENTDLLYLDCSHNHLRGKLDLTNNSKLVGLDCSYNELTRLKISECPNLEMFLCNDNELGGDLPEDLLNHLKNPNKLVCLNISDNNLQGDLADFKKFINLEYLWFGSKDKEKSKFTGLSKSLKGLNKLKSLGVINVDIDDSSGYLSSGKVEEVFYYAEINAEKGQKELTLTQEKINELEKELNDSKDDFLNSKIISERPDKEEIIKQLKLFLTAQKNITANGKNKEAKKQKIKANDYLQKETKLFVELSDLSKKQEKLTKLEMQLEVSQTQMEVLLKK